MLLISSIVDNQEAVVIALAEVDGDRGILLVVALQIELLLWGELTGVDGGRNVGIAMAEHREGVCADVVVDENDWAFGLFDEADDLCIGEDLAVVENSLDGWQRRAHEEIDFVFQSTNPFVVHT